jgi:Flp pilus assembly protein TadB
MDPPDHARGRSGVVTGRVVLATGLLSAAVLVAASSRTRRPARRLAELTRRAGHTAGPARPRWWPPWLDTVRLGAGCGALVVVLLVGGWWGVVGGVAAAALLDRGLRRLEPAARRAHRLQEATDLPLAADLLAVVLRGGTPVDRAVAEVATALPGPLGDRLARVSRLLRLGAAADEAWRQLAPVAGADRLARAAVRSADHGAALAGALTRLADDLRADRAIAIEAAARRAGVLIVLPLGLCFLPAFILAGLVPVIVAVLGDVL